MKAPVLLALLLPTALFLHAEVIHVDFNADLTNGVAELQWDYGTGFKATKEGYQFTTRRAPITSPTYPILAITNVTLSATRTAAATNKYLRLTPISAQGEAIDSLSRTNAFATVQSFHWESADAVTRFSIQMDGSNSGNIYLSAADIYAIVAVETPAGLETTNLFRNAFTATWVKPENSIASTLCVSQQVVSAESYVTNRAWSFENVANDANGGRCLDESLSEQFDGLSGTNIYAAAQSQGFLSIGSNSRFGSLFIPHDTAADGLIFRACKPASDNYGKNMLIQYRRNGSVFSLGEVFLDEEYKEYHLALPQGLDYDDVVLCSTTNHLAAGEKRGAVNVSWIRLVSEYKPAQTNDVLILEKRTAGNRLRVSRLAPGTYRWFVTAETANGTCSKPSPLQEVILTDDLPRFCEGGLALHIR